MRKSTIRKFAVMVIMVMLIASIATMVSAQSVTMNLSSDSKLKESSTVTVKVNLGTIDAGDGIDTIVAQLDYKDSIFEALDASSLSAGAGWTPTFAASTNMLTLTKTSKVTSPETVLTITFKTKGTISENSATIILKDITVSGGRVADGGTGDITVANASVTIAKDIVPEPVQNTTPANTTKVNNVVNTVVKDNTVTNSTTLPKTGVEQVGVIAIVIVAIAGVASFIVYKKIEKVVK